MSNFYKIKFTGALYIISHSSFLCDSRHRSEAVTSPTSVVSLKDFQDYHRNENLSDLIWDDETINDLIDSSSVEPEYARALTPSPPPALPPPRDIGDGGRAVYSCVDPYQGRSMDLSPLVRLNGMNKSKRFVIIYLTSQFSIKY